MSKLFKLKEWVTIPDAAKHLSQLLNEPVSVPDVLQMALDGHFKISVYFPNRAKARLGHVVPFKDLPMREIPSFIDGEILKYPDGSLLDDLKDGEEITEETPFIHFKKDVVSIEGLWDLSLKGNERIDIEFDLQRFIGGPEVTMINIDGTFLNRNDGTWAALQDKLDDRIVADANGLKKKVIGEYFPAGGLVTDCTRVIRTSEIVEFQSRLEGVKIDKPLTAKEKTTYSNIIGAMLELLKTPRPGRTDDAAIIRELVENYGDKFGISESNLNRKLPEAKRSLSAD